ncbi:10873_t:CDS:2, partial [Entrophospora sp. SA101]
FARKATVLVDPREFDNDIQTPVAVNGRGYVTSTTPSAVLAIHNALSINAKNAQKLAQAHAQFKQILEGHVQKH